MNKRSYLLLCFLQIKSAIALLPKLCLTICCSFLFAYGIYHAGREFLSRPEEIKLPVALVLPEDDTYAGLAFSFIERMDSIRSLCSFERTDKETALSLLKSSEVYAVILIPDSFVEHILNGTNSAATLILPRKDTLESILFSTLADAGASTLSTAQSGIYAMEELMISYEQWDSIPKAEEALNRLYLSYALNRGRIFQTETISATGALSLSKYYICSAAVLLLLLSGMGHYSYYSSEPESLKLLFRRQGISPLVLLFSKLMAISGIYLVLLFPILVLAGFLPISSVGGFFILIFSVQSFLLLLCSICSQSGSYILVSAVLSILGLFLSGAFLPSVFLPEAVRQIGQLLPTALFLKLCRELLTDSLSISSIVYGIITGFLFLSTACLLHRCHTGSKRKIISTRGFKI